MEITAQNVEYIKELLKPRRWNSLTSEQKHRLMEIVTEECVLKDLRKAYKAITREESVIQCKEIMEAL